MSEQPHQAPARRQRNNARRTDGHHIGNDYKAMIALMVEDGVLWQIAAKQLGIPLSSARYALTRPHLLGYLKRRRQELLTADAARNYARLREIREQDVNMTAAVAAAKTIEQMSLDAQQPTTRQTTPGVVIQIVAADKQVTVAPSPPVIEHQPDSDQE